MHENILLVNHVKENGTWLKDIGRNANLGEDGLQALNTRHFATIKGLNNKGLNPTT